MAENQNLSATLAANLDEVYSATFTYEFLAGIDTVGTHRPKAINIPKRYLDKMTGMERQYWEIKMKYFDVILFFKKGKFYEIYDCDAVIANKEFGLKMTGDTGNRGKMRMSGVPEQSFAEWSRLFVFKGYKVGKVEQLEVTEEMKAANGGKPPACIPRELMVILTRGTLTENNAIAGPEPVYVTSIVPLPLPSLLENNQNSNSNNNNNNNNSDSTIENSFRYDVVAVDLTRQCYYHCPCENVTELVTLLHHLTPKEVLLPTTVPGLQSTNNNNNNKSAANKNSNPQDIILNMMAHVVTDIFSECHIERIDSNFGLNNNNNNRNSSSSPSSLPPSWYLVHSYFTYLKIDANRLLPTKFITNEENTKNTNNNNNNDNDDEEQDDHLLIFKTYTQHRKSNTTNDDVPPPETFSLMNNNNNGNKNEKILSIERRFDSGMTLDSAAIECLDLVSNSRDGSTHFTILSWLLAERSSLPSAARMIRAWLLRPSSNQRVITARQDAVQILYDPAEELKNPFVNAWNQLLEKQQQQGGGSAGGKAAATMMMPDIKTEQGDDDDENDDDDGDDENNNNKKSSGGPRSRGPWQFQENISIASVDFERLLSRISDFKSEDTRVALAEPLVHYPKNLNNIHYVLKGFEMLLGFQSSAGKALKDFVRARPQMQPKSKLLQELLDDIGLIRKPMNEILKKFPRQRIEKDGGLLLPTPGQCAAFDAAENTINDCANVLNKSLRELRDKFGTQDIRYVDIGKDLFLVEVPTKLATQAALEKLGFKKGELNERARTQKNVKFSVTSLQKTIDDHKKATTSRELAVVNFLREEVAAAVCGSWHLLFNAARAAGYLDCLFALANVARQQAHRGEICFPAFESSPAVDQKPHLHNVQTSIDLEQAYHPLLVLFGRKCVPNNITLGGYDEATNDDTIARLLVLTGPNAAGKSTAMRVFAVNAILAQMGGAVCAKSMTIVGAPIDRVFTRIGARDATHRGQSTLFVELSEIATILKEATGRSLCLIDELGRGTSTHDGYAIAHACLRSLAGITDEDLVHGNDNKNNNNNNNKHHVMTIDRFHRLPLVMFATHYHALALEVSLLQGKPRQRVQLGYMEFSCGARRERTDDDDDSKNINNVDDASSSVVSSSNNNNNASSSVRTDIVFLYRLIPGICARSYGAEVALQAGLPRDLVERARAVSRQMALVSADHQLADFAKFMKVTLDDIRQMKATGEEVNEDAIMERVRSRASQLIALAHAATAAAN